MCLMIQSEYINVPAKTDASCPRKPAAAAADSDRLNVAHHQSLSCQCCRAFVGRVGLVSYLVLCEDNDPEASELDQHSVTSISSTGNIVA